MNEEHSIVPKQVNDLIDKIEDVMVNDMTKNGEYKVVELPLRHFFVNGMYAREMTAPADTYITSKIHKVDHFFNVSKGKLSVWDDEGGEQIIEAPYFGITKAGTRRVAYVWEDLVWTTYHFNPENLDEFQLEEQIIEKHENLLLNSHKNLPPCLS